MSEKMYPIPFDSLMNWVTSEYAQCGDVFGVHKHYHASGKSLPIFALFLKSMSVTSHQPTFGRQF